MDLKDDFRWIIDNGSDSEDRPLAAVLLPDELIIFSDGTVMQRGSQSIVPVDRQAQGARERLDSVDFN